MQVQVLLLNLYSNQSQQQQALQITMQIGNF